MGDRLHHGHCLCGDVRFAARGEPRLTAWCHCASCRRQTGAPAAAFADYSRDRVHFSGVAPTLYESSPGVRRGFCARCGSTLSFESDDDPREISLHVGAFDEPGHFAPVAVSHAHERLTWVPGGSE